jgi:hypothetical protein
VDSLHQRDLLTSPLVRLIQYTSFEVVIGYFSLPNHVLTLTLTLNLTLNPILTLPLTTSLTLHPRTRTIGMKTPAQLVGRQVLRDFGKHGAHKGAITSFDEDGELTYRVQYDDGDCEDLADRNIRDMLIDKRVVRVSSRKTRRDKDEEDSESDYFDEDLHLLQGVQTETLDFKRAPLLNAKGRISNEI